MLTDNPNLRQPQRFPATRNMNGETKSVFGLIGVNLCPSVANCIFNSP